MLDSRLRMGATFENLRLVSGVYGVSIRCILCAAVNRVMSFRTNVRNLKISPSGRNDKKLNQWPAKYTSFPPHALRGAQGFERLRISAESVRE